jgi:hypothetical protein
MQLAGRTNAIPAAATLPPCCIVALQARTHIIGRINCLLILDRSQSRTRHAVPARAPNPKIGSSVVAPVHAAVGLPTNKREDDDHDLLWIVRATRRPNGGRTDLCPQERERDGISLTGDPSAMQRCTVVVCNQLAQTEHRVFAGTAGSNVRRMYLRLR